MKLALRILGLSILAIVPAVAVAASSSKQVWVTNCRHEQYKPKKIVIACGDGSEYLTNLKWSRWSARKAQGKGKLHANSCTPSCANGHFNTYPVVVTLRKPRSCKGQKHRVFDRLTLRFGRNHPHSTPTEKAKLGCPTK